MVTLRAGCRCNTVSAWIRRVGKATFLGWVWCGYNDGMVFVEYGMGSFFFFAVCDDADTLRFFARVRLRLGYGFGLVTALSRHG